ncbi:MAG: hypothetical protein AB1779_10070 [Candidatus Thermoplasmatota archaeon]
MSANIEDHILLLLSIKKKGYFVDFEHIYEKVGRDTGIAQNEFHKVMNELRANGLIEEREKKYSILPEGYKKISYRLKEIGNELNKSYRMVYDAKRYYNVAAEEMLKYLKGRAVSGVKIFSDKNDPINNVSPTFVRYIKYKPKPKLLTIESKEEIIKLVDEHLIDFIPYVHKLNEERPDWFVIDLDAGKRYKEEKIGFELLKVVAENICAIFEEGDVLPALKFSGSRGIQIWASFAQHPLPKNFSDYFSYYRALAIAIQKETEKRLQRCEEKDNFYKITMKGKEITTSSVAKKDIRDDQILIDWSTMKPSGDVRAPFSIHYKTGLVSVPIRELKSFKIEDGEIDNVIKNFDSLKFKLCESDGTKLFKKFGG